MTAKTEKKGIDVSYWQGRIDWAKVKGAGIEFAILRAVAGQNTDSEFQNNLKGVIENKIPFGVYIYTKAKSLAEIDSEFTLLKNALGDTIAPLGIFYDMEDISLRNLSKDTLTDNLIYAMQKSAQLGHKGIIYSNPDWLTYVLDYERLKSYPLWLACYTTKERRYKLFPHDIYIWQYGNDKIDGINAIVDVNIMYENKEPQAPEYSQIKVTNCLAAWVRKAPDKSSKPISVVAKNAVLKTDNAEFSDNRGILWLRVFTKYGIGYIAKRYTQKL